MTTTTPNQGTGYYPQIKDLSDIEQVNRAFRYYNDQLDALAGRRGNVPLGSDINLNGNKGTNAADPTDGTDLVTKQYADAHYGPGHVQAQLGATGSNPLIVSGLQGTLQDMQPTVFYGTHTQRLQANPQLGTFWWETDRTVLYFGAPSGAGAVWVYAAGIYGSTLASIAADLGANDIGFVQWVSVQNHLFAWAGAAWVFIDEEGGYFVDRVGAPTGSGYQLCDGTATDYLQISGASIVATAFTTPDETTANPGTYHKSAAAYTGVINPATAPGITGSTGSESAHTHAVTSPTGGPSATTTVDNTLAGSTVAVGSAAHTHAVTSPTGAGSSHLHTAGTLTVDGAAQPKNMGVLKYFRR